MYHDSDYIASFFFSVQSVGRLFRDLIYIDVDLYRYIGMFYTRACILEIAYSAKSFSRRRICACIFDTCILVRRC